VRVEGGGVREQVERERNGVRYLMKGECDGASREGGRGGGAVGKRQRGRWEERGLGKRGWSEERGGGGGAGGRQAGKGQGW